MLQTQSFQQEMKIGTTEKDARAKLVLNNIKIVYLHTLLA